MSVICAVNNSDELLQICQNDVFGTKISAYYDVYSPFSQNDGFYIQKNGDEIFAALSKIDSNVVLTAKEDVDFSEISSFLHFYGFSTIQCDIRVADKLGLKPDATGYVVEFTNKITSENSDLLFSDAYCVDYKQLYRLLSDCGFDMPQYSNWLADFSLRLRRQKAFVCEKQDGEKLICTASALFVSESSVLLGAVATRPEYRGKGMAGELVSFMASYFSSQGKTVRLMCREKMLPFYERLGFVKAGEWAQINDS